MVQLLECHAKREFIEMFIVSLEREILFRKIVGAVAQFCLHHRDAFESNLVIVPSGSIFGTFAEVGVINFHEFQSSGHLGPAS